jgi:hypothetical protein
MKNEEIFGPKINKTDVGLEDTTRSLRRDELTADERPELKKNK